MTNKLGRFQLCERRHCVCDCQLFDQRGTVPSSFDVQLTYDSVAGGTCSKENHVYSCSCQAITGSAFTHLPRSSTLTGRSAVFYAQYGHSSIQSVYSQPFWRSSFSYPDTALLMCMPEMRVNDQFPRWATYNTDCPECVVTCKNGNLSRTLIVSVYAYRFLDLITNAAWLDVYGEFVNTLGCTDNGVALDYWSGPLFGKRIALSSFNDAVLPYGIGELPMIHDRNMSTNFGCAYTNVHFYIP